MTELLPPSVPVSTNQGQLAYELAAGIYDVNVIAARHSLTAGQLIAIVAAPSFRQLFAAAKAAYEADDNLETRMQTKARLGLESNIAHVTNIANNNCAEDVSHTTQLQASSLLHDITGAKKTKPPEHMAGDKFTLNISLAGEDKPITINAVHTEDQYEE